MSVPRILNREPFPAVLYVRRRWWGGLDVVRHYSLGDVAEYVRRGSLIFQRVATTDRCPKIKSNARRLATGLRKELDSMARNGENVSTIALGMARSLEALLSTEETGS